MKFDCVKLSGKLDFVHVISPLRDGYKVTLSVDGFKIPNVTLTRKFYEELESGEQVTLYGIFKNSKKKEKNDGVIYGIQKANGDKAFATQFRFVGPLMLALYAAIAFCIVFAIGWFANWFPVAFLFTRSTPDAFFYRTTILAIVEGALVASFFLWRAWLLVKVTNSPDEWPIMEPATLSSRFSKFHK